MLLEVKDLETEFKVKRGTVKAVNGVSFEVDKGEILAVVGESGSGKSVTSLSVMGLIRDPGRVAGGEILFNGENLLKKSTKEMQAVRGDKISMIFQEPMTSLNPVYRVKDQIMETILTHTTMNKKEALKRAIEMLDLVGIPAPEQRVNDYPHQMSGGVLFSAPPKVPRSSLFGISLFFHLISFRQYQKIMPLFSYVTSDFPFIFCINCITLFSKMSTVSIFPCFLEYSSKNNRSGAFL